MLNLSPAHRFALEPLYKVPLNIHRHQIYTSSSQAISAAAKRTLESRNRKRMSPREERELDMILTYLESPRDGEGHSKRRAIEGQLDYDTWENLGDRQRKVFELTEGL